MPQDLDEGLTDFFRDKTGLVIDAYFSATKLRWILEEVPGVRERAEKGELLFGTVDTWLLWKLTKGRVHVTDYSNASRTMLFNIRELKWDEEILEKLGIPACMHPPARFMGKRIPASWEDRSPWQGSQETSRRPSSARPASMKGMRRIPTVQDVSF